MFSRILNKKESSVDFGKFIKVNKKRLLNSKRNSDFVEALMEFGALICKPKDPKCSICNLIKSCKYSNSSNKINITNKKMIKNINYDVFCYLTKKNK